jgi:hypothetical protein
MQQITPGAGVLFKAWLPDRTLTARSPERACESPRNDLPALNAIPGVIKSKNRTE